MKKVKTSVNDSLPIVAETFILSCRFKRVAKLGDNIFNEG